MIILLVDNLDVTNTLTLLRDFVDRDYLPFIERTKRQSTYRGYANMWKHYLLGLSDISLRDFRTSDGDRILEQVAREHVLSVTTLAHIKAFLSGVFRYAKRKGALHTENPMRDAAVPSGAPAGETYAYSLEETLTMLQILPEPATTAVATAAFTGVRKGELRGLLWENYDGENLGVRQSVWRGFTNAPKSRKSNAPVPVIPLVAERLNLLRQLAGFPVAGLIFPSPENTPLNLDKLAVEVIRPILAKAGIVWHGWHAFRRGLATNLHRMGVPDKTIQRILRHANVVVTQTCYIKTVGGDAAEAMRSLQAAVDALVKGNMYPLCTRSTQDVVGDEKQKLM